MRRRVPVLRWDEYYIIFDEQTHAEWTIL